MKVVIVTGRLMEEQVRSVAERFGHEVYAAPADIAAFIKKEHLQELRGYNIMLIPGYAQIDLQLLEEETGIKTFKGPKDISNLGMVLKHLGSIELSKSQPACALMKDEMARLALTEISKVESGAVRSALLDKPGNLLIGDLPVGRNFPMRVVAEIVDADKMTDGEVMKRAGYYQEQGADIIDIGISEPAPIRVRSLIKLLRKEVSLPLSMDSMDPQNITAALEAGVDMVMSLDEEVLTEVPPTDRPVVIVPGRVKFNNAEERLSALNRNLDLSKEKGFTRVIADPILEPINYGLTDSISVYRSIGKASTAPMLMGVGNVTELTDADSTGINAVLAGVAMECGASLLFTTEASDKTRGCVSELKSASQMMFLAKMRKTTPKDLGIDLLRYKEKTRVHGPPSINARQVCAKRGKLKQDPRGDFTILVDEKIRAVHSKDGIADISVEGDRARDICDTILRLGLISELSHAMYLGKELEKAETALKTGRSYIQDETLF